MELFSLIDMTGKSHDVMATGEVMEVADTLRTCRRGGFATVHGYVSGLGSAKCITPGVSDVTFISRFSYKARNLKRLAILKTVTMDDIGETDADLFGTALAELIKSAEDTKADASDARREAHRTFYVPIAEGVTAHLKTTKVGGETELVLSDGLPIVESIMVRGLEISKRVMREGAYKPTNSRAKTIVKDKINKLLDKQTGTFKNYKLVPGSFDSLSIDGERIIPADLVDIVED